MKANVPLLSYLSQFFLEWEMFQTKVVEKIKTHFFTSNNFLVWKSCLLWHNVAKHSATGQDTDDNMAHANFTLSA
jgi:hypothetical protein